MPNRIAFVGNEWEETGFIADLSDSLAAFEKQDSVFVLTTYNDEENEFYESPPGVGGVKDRITNTRSKEQSLVMKFNNLPGGAIAEARKTLFSKIKLVNYKRLKMFMYGQSTDGKVNIPENADVDSSGIEFYLRFGADDKNFYEYYTISPP